MSGNRTVKYKNKSELDTLIDKFIDFYICFPFIYIMIKDSDDIDGKGFIRQLAFKCFIV